MKKQERWFKLPHDFKQFPELTNSQMPFYYLESPHKQITEDFKAKVVKVHDGDTITVRWIERNFDFPVRFLGTNAPELNEPRGHEIQEWLEGLLLNEEIEISINPRQRVGKWGRILGKIFFRGMDIGDDMMRMGRATSFENRNEGQIPALAKEMMKHAP